MGKFIGKKDLIKEVLSIVSISLIGCAGIVFFTLYFDVFETGFYADYGIYFTAITVTITSCLTVVTIIFYKLSKNFLYKLFLLTIFLVSVGIGIIYLLEKIGFWDKINSIEDFREYIKSFGAFAVIIFIIIQFLQVVILPIPSFITVGAGVLLFGPLYSAIFSSIGIISGSIVAFYIGRRFGYPVVKWLVGEINLNKGLNVIKGKDKVFLSFMYLFPFFPDDILCFVAGITTISSVFYLIMIFVTRIITVFFSCYFFNNNILPYNTWWGILLWAVLIIFTILISFLICKKGDKIERFIFSKSYKKNNR